MNMLKVVERVNRRPCAKGKQRGWYIRREDHIRGIFHFAGIARVQPLINARQWKPIAKPPRQGMENPSGSPLQAAVLYRRIRLLKLDNAKIGQVLISGKDHPIEGGCENDE